MARLGAPATPATLDALFTRWEEIAGAELSQHVRPRRINGTTLVLAADHATWATRARMESGRILGALGTRTDSRIDRVEVVVERP